VSAERCVAQVTVQLVHSPQARDVQCRTLTVPAGSTLDDALKASGWFPQGGDGLALGIWGRKMPPDTVVREGDRIEVYRGLTVDPKEARRQRYRAQGEKLPKGYHRPRDWVKDMTQSPGPQVCGTQRQR
jgi:putative ubiquitin-RnfH superfamily antitoxin RatB of RatAB toxin-antitoxin module